MFSSHTSHPTLPVYGVVKQRSSSAPLAASARCRSIPTRWEVNSGWVTTIRRTPSSAAAPTTASISSALR